MNVCLLLAHSIEESAQLQLLTELGHSVFSIGAYSNPAKPGDDKRPPLPDVPYFPDLDAACHRKRIEHTADPIPGVIDWAKSDLPQEVIDWADIIICHHIEHTWLAGPNWPRIRDKRVIWRTVGQSVENNERIMAPLRADGLQIVRYSPRERNIPHFCGEDALIRFWVDPAEWYGWTGDQRHILNITQHLKSRDPFTNWRAWEQIARNMPRRALGPGSEELDGPGTLPLDEMKQELRDARCYLYCGTQPASYTLGLIEAMMTGVPVVSIGPEWHDVFPYGSQLFEGYELAGLDCPSVALQRRMLDALLKSPKLAADISREQHKRALDLFGKAKVAAQWASFLGAP